MWFMRFELNQMKVWIMIALMLIIPVASHADVTDGLVGWWKFNEGSGVSAADSSGQGNTGTLTNGPVWVVGKTGQGLSFDGSNDYVSLGNPNAVRFTGSHSLAAWVKSNSVSDQDIISKGTDQSNGYSYIMNANTDLGSNLFVCVVSPDGTAATLAARYSAAADNVGNWYHVACIYNSSAQTLDIYVNGVLSNGTLVGTVPSSIFNTTDEADIGQRSNGIGRWDGLIDDARMYNRVLTAQEVYAIYMSGAPRMQIRGGGRLSNVKFR
jgi:hypothetical protein